MSHGSLIKKITICPSSEPKMELERSIWVEYEESDDEEVSQQVISVDGYLAIREKLEDDVINDFIVSTS